MRRAISDAMMTATSALILVLVLVAFDDNVRDQVTQQLASHPADAIAGVSERGREIVAIVVASAHEQSLMHAPLLLFAVAGVVLVLFMLRT
jgi:hypothetical protein